VNWCTQIILYDDCERLLECRIAKKDEVVSSGETLTFNAYLVDVGDPEGGHKALSDLNSQGSDKKITEKPVLLKRQKFRNHSVSFGIAITVSSLRVSYVLHKNLF
jgi:hypothetical protein